MKQIRMNKKAQMGGLENAPGIVMIIGLLFLTMATVALIGQKYGDSLDTDNTAGSAVNQSVTRASIISTSGATLSSLENVVCSSITSVFNGTGGVSIAVGNFTQVGCNLKNSSSMADYDATSLLVSYPYTYSLQTVASNTTGSLETEIANNTSIAGIVLTISLVGIVLTILIGVFMGMNRRTTI